MKSTKHRELNRLLYTARQATRFRMPYEERPAYEKLVPISILSGVKTRKASGMETSRTPHPGQGENWQVVSICKGTR